MDKSILLSLTLFLCLAFKDATSKPVEEISFIEGLNFRFENDTWTCGDIKCPANTFGCKIILKNVDDDAKIVNKALKCFDKEKTVTFETEYRIELLKEKKIDIEVETFLGAESAYNIAYGLGGHENAKGVIAVDKLHDLKETGKINKNLVIKSNANIQ